MLLQSDRPLSTLFNTGDPEAAPPERVSDLQWTLLAGPDYAVVIRPLGDDPTRLSLLVHEAPETGQLDVEAAEKLGISRGPLFGKLKRGETVLNDEGRRISPADVLGPGRRGRRVAVVELAGLPAAPEPVPLPSMQAPMSEGTPCDALVALVDRAAVDGAGDAIARAALAAKAREVIYWTRDATACAAVDKASVVR